MAGRQSDALETEPDAERMQTARLCCWMNDMMFWATSFSMMKLPNVSRFL